MLVAKKLVKSNVGEYLIYMYQIEDLIRACQFNKQMIEQNLVQKYEVDEASRVEIKQWYFGLSDLMQEEQLQENGHLTVLQGKIAELNDFHIYLLNRNDQQDYKLSFDKIKILLDTLQTKSKTEISPVQLIIDAIYGVYILKLKKQEVSQDTQQSIVQLSSHLSLLSAKFKSYESGEIKYE